MFVKHLLFYFFSHAIIKSSMSVNFDFSIPFCRFKCSSECESTSPDAKEESTSTKGEIKGYFWRDYHGHVPEDAFPIGDANQSPQTYIGYVFDPLNNGSFMVTILDGLNYVFTGHKGVVHKITEDIKILCTHEPGKMGWIHATDYSELDPEERLVPDTSYTVDRDYHFTYAARTRVCDINYAGSMEELDEPMEFVLVDGTPKSAAYFEILYYKLKKEGGMGEGKKEESKGNVPLIRHHYEYSVRPNSIIPNFFKSLTIGPCSVTCTNEGGDKKKGGKNGSMEDTKPDPAMDYFWTPTNFFSTSLALLTGYNSDGDIYTAQAWTDLVGLDVGYTTSGEAVSLVIEDGYYYQSYEVYTLSTITPDKFKWVPTDSKGVLSMNRSTFISGGKLSNGTKVYIGRKHGIGKVNTASIRIFDGYAYAYFYSYGEPGDTFDILVYTG